jgi:hypothetical protein
LIWLTEDGGGLLDGISQQGSGQLMGRADEVLAQLDSAADGFRFPDLNHGFRYAVDARLRALGDAARWALVVETAGYSPRGGRLVDVVHTFGNCLTSGEPGYENEDVHDRIGNPGPAESQGCPERFSGAVPLVVSGQVIPVGAPPGEELSATFRRLVPDHRDLLFGDDAQVRRRLPADLPQLLQLEEWNQPDLFVTPPSQSETYQLVAAVLQTLDPARYRPALAPNTHWSNWPDSGSL